MNSRRFLRRFFLMSLAIFLLSLTLVSCGEKTKRELAQEPELRVRLDRFFEETESLDADFPYELDAIELSGPLDPPPTFENTLTLSTRELGNIASDSPLTSDNYLSLNTAWGVGSILEETYASEPVEEGWLEKVNDLLDTRYLVIYWALNYDPPRIVKDEHYEGGTATVVVNLYDRETRTFLQRFEVPGTASGMVEAQSEKWKLKMNLEFEINQLLRKQILAAMRTKLEETTGGSLPYDQPSDGADSETAQPDL